MQASLPKGLTHRRYRILAVDDQADNLTLMQLVLEAQGYEVSTANNGWEALIQAKTFFPDLILVDLEMPEIDGYAIIRYVRHNQALKSIPIVLLTACGIDYGIHGLELGANGFFCLPFDIDEFSRKIQRFLHGDRLEIEACC